MPRFYLPNADFSENQLTLLDAQELHHLKNVLRVKTGATIELFNGRGTSAQGILEELTLKHAKIRLTTRSMENQGTRTKIILACAIPKKAKFEYILEKTTELDVDEIIPVLTARTEVKLDAVRAALKHKRYQAVAVNAAKQCGRAHLPVVHPISKFKDTLVMLKDVPLKIIPSLVGERKTLNEIFDSTKPTAVCFIIGPEGDFTAEEISLSLREGFVPASLGPNVLKVDTAAIAVVAFARLKISPS